MGMRRRDRRPNRARAIPGHHSARQSHRLGDRRPRFTRGRDVDNERKYLDARERRPREQQRLLADLAKAHPRLRFVTVPGDVDDDAVAELVVAHVIADAQPELFGAARAARGLLVLATQGSRDDSVAMRAQAATVATTTGAPAAAARLVVTRRCD